MHKQKQAIASGRPEAVLQTTASLFSHLDAAPCWSPVFPVVVVVVVVSKY